MSDKATLAAGTIVRFSSAMDVPVYDKIITGLLSFGAAGKMSESKERTTLADLTKQYGAGMEDSPDKTLNGQHYALDADQLAFVALAKAKASIMVQVEYPAPVGASKGLVATMELKLLGFQLDEVAGEDWMMFTVNAKQNSFDFVNAVATV